MNDLYIVPGSGMLIAPKLGQYLLNVQDPLVLQRLTTNIPGVFVEPNPKGNWVALPMHEDTLTILGNMGYSTRGMEPLYVFYQTPKVEGEFDPWPHQIATAAFLSARRRAFCANTMRTGKTSSAIMAADYLQTVEGVTGACLVVCTVSTMRSVWASSIRSAFEDRKVVVLHGGVGKQARLRKLKEAADYYIINYDGLKMCADELIQEVRDKRIRIGILDEVTHYSRETSQRWKAADAIFNDKEHPIEYLWGLSGNMGGNSMGTYGIIKLVNPNRLPCSRKSTWQEMVQYRYGRETWMWRDRPEARQVIQKFLQPTIRFEKEDVLHNLPPVTKKMLEVPLSDQQRRLYDVVKSELVAYLDSGEVIEAGQASALLHKLFQISLGTVIGKDGKLIELDNRPRLEALLEVIEEAEYKTVIFCNYTAPINQLVKQLNEKKIKTEKVDGSVTGVKRDKHFYDFMHDDNLRVLVCHPITTAFGTELAAASNMAFNGPPMSGDFIYEQALHRLQSSKQKAPSIGIDQVFATAEEHTFFKGMDGKVSNNSIINGLLADISGRPIKVDNVQKLN